VSRYTNPFIQYFDKNGNPLNSGTIEFFSPSTNFQKDTFSNPELTNKNSNPVVLDGEGRARNIFLDGEYKIRLKDKEGRLIDEADPINDVLNLTSSGLSFLSTTENLINDINFTPAIGFIIETLGYSSSGDGGADQWQFKGLTGQTPSQSPADLGDALLNDASGNQWALVVDSVINVKSLGAKGTGTDNDTLAIQASINSAKVITKTDIVGKVVFVAGSLYFPPGIYLHDELTSNVGIRIFGNDMSTTQLLFNQAVSATGAITFDDVSDELFAVLIDGISLFPFIR